MILIASALLLNACHQQSPETFDTDTIEQEVTARLEAFVVGLNSGDTEGLPDFYSQSERFYWVEDGKITYPNHQALAGSLQGLYQSLESAEMKVLDRKVTVLDAESASIYSEYEQALKMKSGFGFSINGAMTALMVKEEGVWRFLIGHSSTKKERGG